MALLVKIVFQCTASDKFKLKLDIQASIKIPIHGEMSWLEIWGNLDLNQGPTGYESAALTTELLPRKNLRIYRNCVQESTRFLLPAPKIQSHTGSSPLDTA